jgi:hypothetical protein
LTAYEIGVHGKGHGRGHRLDWAYGLRSRYVSLPYIGTSCCRLYWLYLLPESLSVSKCGNDREADTSSFLPPPQKLIFNPISFWTDRLLLELPCSNGEPCSCCPFQTNQPEIGHIPLSSPDL